jgi:hypothetical protein
LFVDKPQFAVFQAELSCRWFCWQKALTTKSSDSLSGGRTELSNCTSCGQTMPEGTIKCGNCGAPLRSQPKISASLPQFPIKGASGFPNSAADTGELSLRLQKAMRRTELLSYAAAGLAVAILAVILLLSIL